MNEMKNQIIFTKTPKNPNKSQEKPKEHQNYFQEKAKSKAKDDSKGNPKKISIEIYSYKL